MIFLILLLSLFFAAPTFALDPIIKISNFSSNSSPEWVEINNTTENTISLDGWQIADGNSSTSDDLLLSGCLSPLSYQSFYHDSGWLNDGGDTINLYDSQNNLIDQLVYTKGKYDASPRFTNTCTPSPFPTPTVTPVITPEPTTSPEPNPLIITEIMANPESGETEWIEIYNPNDIPYPLKDLCFFDASSHSRCFSDTDIIAASSYFLLSINSGFLNNSGDQVTFLNNSILYPKSPKNLSYSRQQNDSWCFANPSPSSVNNDCLSTVSTSTEKSYTPPLLSLQFSPDSVPAGQDFNLVFSLNSADAYSLRLISPFGTQYFPFGNYQDGYSWLTLPLSVPKKLPPAEYPLLFHLKKADSSHLYDFDFGTINVTAPVPTVKASKVLGVQTYTPISFTYPTPIFTRSDEYIPFQPSFPDLIFFSWPFLFSGSILFLSPLIFPKLYSA